MPRKDSNNRKIIISHQNKSLIIKEKQKRFSPTTKTTFKLKKKSNKSKKYMLFGIVKNADQPLKHPLLTPLQTNKQLHQKKQNTRVPTKSINDRKTIRDNQNQSLIINLDRKLFLSTTSPTPELKKK